MVIKYKKYLPLGWFSKQREHTQIPAYLLLNLILFCPYMLLRDCLFQGSNTQIFPNLENGRTYKEASKMQPVRSKNVSGHDTPTFLQTTS